MKTKSSDAQHKPPYIFFPMNHFSINKWLQFRKNGQVVILVGVRLGTCIKGSLFEPLCGYLTLCVVYLRQDTLSECVVSVHQAAIIATGFTVSQVNSMVMAIFRL